MKKYFSILITFILILISLSVLSQNYLTQLTSKKEFDTFCGLPLANKYGNVKAVKIVYDLKSKKIYYLNSKIYKNHYEFCKEELKYNNGYGNFLNNNYSKNTKRKYLLANINYFQSLKKYVLEISPTDLMPKEQIIKIYNIVKSSLSFNKELYFITNSPRLQNLFDDNSKINIITPRYIYANLTYQAISKYKNVGVLKFIDNFKSNKLKINPTDIIVIKNTPNYLPLVAGIIVTEFQTPLSHISILGLNRKIPICAYTKAFNLKELIKLNGQNVSFTVKSDTFLIKPTTNTYFYAKNKTKKIELKSNLNIDSIIDIENLNLNSYTFVGSKAANFAELYHLSKNANFKTPECAFAIPFYFYNEHIKSSKAYEIITKLTTEKPTSTKVINEYLKEIRNRIKKYEINKELINEVRNKILNDGRYTSFRFRSSTNAEDIKGFSGAGLYKSKTGKLYNDKKSIEKAIKSVWASNWSNKAYYEREYYNIDQNKVYMGILVHRSFPNEKVNGVAITKNIYRLNSNGFLINAQLGNEKVVNPKNGTVCDQFLCFPQKANKIYNNKIVIDIISYSSLTNNNKLIMTNNEIQNLANQLDVIKKHFAGGSINKWSYVRLGYDIEFKLDGDNRQLYIKQIRLYND